jgi:asparagine synthase (glutamine-hydrolysing)
MCGIAGRFHPIRLALDRDWHCRADLLLAHRGPDGHGHYLDTRCELVHRRLALLDLSPTGDQPMANEDGSIHVVFNGEIYNHLELRKELAKAHVFRSTSDTEILVHLYEDLGTDMISRLQGMFAFVIYDARNNRMLLGRDRLGIKPLYYTFVQDELVFASEMKAILSLSGFEPQLDRQACYDFLGLSYIPEPATGYRNIWMLPKGHFLLYAGPPLPAPRRYWCSQGSPDANQGFAHAVDWVGEALTDAVAAYIVADVPVAALLSGGIDSSLIVSSYSRQIRQPLRTFNVRFPDKNYDETSLAMAVANQCGTGHTTVDVDMECITADLAVRLLGHFDQPFADTSLIPMYLVSKAIRSQGIICTLSGDGGDEVFGGYDCFWRANKLTALARLPALVGTSIAHIGRWSEQFTYDLGRQLRKAAELARTGRTNTASLLAGLSNYLTEPQKEELLLDEARTGLLPAQRLFENGCTQTGGTDLEELSRRMTENLFDVALPSDMLRKVDMMSMLAGIEVRVPFLEDRVVKFGLSLPHGFKTDGHRGKLVLRALAERWLPTAVATHPKHGFAIPLDVLLTDSFFDMLRDLLLASDSRTRPFLNIVVLRRWLDLLHRARSGDRSGSAMSREGLYQRIFIVLALELWMRNRRISW